MRLRQRVTKGAGSRTKGLLMAYKLVAMAQRRWRRLNGAHLLPRVRAGVVFVDGMLMPRTPTRICPVIRPPGSSVSVYGSGSINVEATNAHPGSARSFALRARRFRFMGQGP